MIKQTIFYSRRIGFNCGADIFREFIDYGCVLIFDKASDILAKRKNGNANANRSTGQTNKSEREKDALKIAEMYKSDYSKNKPDNKLGTTCNSKYELYKLVLIVHNITSF